MRIIPKVTDSCASKLLEGAFGANDVLGYRSFGGPVDDADDDAVEPVTESDQTDFISELATDALTGRQTTVLEKLLKARCQDRMDLVTATLLLDMGVVPAAALELRRTLMDCNRSLDIADEADDNGRTVVFGDKDGWEVDLDVGGDTTWWSSRGIIQTPRLPEVLSDAGSGRPLREVLSHPALDSLDLVIERIETDDRRSCIHLAGCALGQQGLVTLDVGGLERMRKATTLRSAA